MTTTDRHPAIAYPMFDTHGYFHGIVTPEGVADGYTYTLTHMIAPAEYGPLIGPYQRAWTKPPIVAAATAVSHRGLLWPIVTEGVNAGTASLPWVPSAEWCYTPNIRLWPSGFHSID
jgi:hypothetical protein